LKTDQPNQTYYTMTLPLDVRDSNLRGSSRTNEESLHAKIPDGGSDSNPIKIPVHSGLRLLQQSSSDQADQQITVTSFLYFLLQLFVLYVIFRSCLTMCRRTRQQQRGPRNLNGDANGGASTTAGQQGRSRQNSNRVQDEERRAIRRILDRETRSFKSINNDSNQDEQERGSSPWNISIAMTSGADSRYSTPLQSMPPPSAMVCQLAHDVDDDSEQICPICLDEFQPNDQVIRKGCDHVFHRHCIERWLPQKGRNCPYCREVMITDQEIQQNIR